LDDRKGIQPIKLVPLPPQFSYGTPAESKPRENWLAELHLENRCESGDNVYAVSDAVIMHV